MIADLVSGTPKEKKAKKLKFIEDDTVYHKNQIESDPDFVLVYRVSKVSLRAAALLEEYLRNLEDFSVHHETDIFSMNNDVVFVKLYVRSSILYDFSEAYFIDLACNNAEFKPPVTRPFWKFMRNELNDPLPNGVLHKRAPLYMDVTKPPTITKAEKILVLHNILMSTRFGKSRYDYGLEKLISKGIFECAFPLHDGPHEWTETGPLNERQLLKEYWSPLRCACKHQPADVIHHYFGPQTSFFFAWRSFYNKMLVPVAFAGILFFVSGVFLFGKHYKLTIDEICNSNVVMCPKCHTRNCKYESLSSGCFTATFTHAFDNPLTFSFAILMSVWATVVMRLWKREETILSLKWDLRSLEIDNSMRYGFIDKATERRISPVTGELEPCVSKSAQCRYYMFTFSVMLLLVIFNALCTIIIMLLSYHLNIVIIKYSTMAFFREHASSISSLVGMIFSAILVKIISLGYHRITLWLTNIENPRTQIDFDNSYIYKIYVLAFVNNYSTVFYNGFFKGRFFTHPGDSKQYKAYFGIATDLCDPAGCVLNTSMYIAISMVFKESFVSNLAYITKTMFYATKNCTLRYQKKKSKPTGEQVLVKQWEADYLLAPVRKSNILEEYLDLAIQYGYVTFFVACFPLAPALALIYNVIEIRLDATKKVVSYRRPVPYKVMGMGAWNGIFQAATIIGVVTNALVIAFTSEFISKESYRSQMRTLKGYVESSLSAFNTSDFVDVGFEWNTEPICYYGGERHGPKHPRKYERTNYYTLLLSNKLTFIAIFEHMLLLLTGIISYCVTTTPYDIQQLISNQEKHFKHLRMKSLAEEALANKNQRARKEQMSTITTKTRASSTELLRGFSEEEL